MPRLRLPFAAGGAARLVFSTRSHGDLAVGGDPDVLASRRAAIIDSPWTWLRQVHGADVVITRHPGEHAGVEADAIVTTVAEAPIAVHAADCAPIALVHDAGAIAVVHAGWRGLVAGVVSTAVDALSAAVGAASATHRGLAEGEGSGEGAGSGEGGDPASSESSPRPIRAVLGACIRPADYEFGAADLDEVEAVLGPSVRGTTRSGTPALDLPAAVRAALDACGVTNLTDTGWSTAEDQRWYSHRARRESGRHALVAWIDPTDPADGTDRTGGIVDTARAGKW